ncbi:hypothetical protein B0H19DRAFT_1258834 [Mycena capillaripes]|nr:hypothetical protein B0H19DRAFT_1258834 [Mycena capillaripes]
MHSISIEEIQIIAQACTLSTIDERVTCLGIFLCTFAAAVYTHFSISPRTTQLKILFAIACAMFLISTGHFVITICRAIHTLAPSPSKAAPGAFLGDSSSWYLITADVLYVTQCILGDSIAIYRCWILWDRDIRVVAPLLLLLTGNIISGYTACQKLATSSPGWLYNPTVRAWMLAFYASGVAHTAITTTVTATRVWWLSRRLVLSAPDAHPHPRLQTTILLLVESAALYLALQVVVLATFVARSNVQFLLLGSVPPVIGITFTLIAVRVGRRARCRLEAANPSGTGKAPTIGSIAMHQITFGLTDGFPTDVDGEAGKFN